jgi:hypothetical protein
MNNTDHTFVTVVFDVEFDFVLLQARSMRIYCTPEIVHQIIIIDNSNGYLNDTRQNRILSEYGHLAKKVRFFRAADIAKIPRKIGGWRTQQILKLLISRNVETPKYIILDAKNHLVYPLKRAFLEAPDGRARINVQGYRDHPMGSALEHVLKYLGVQPAPYLDKFTPTDPPFIMYTDVVESLIHYIRQKEGIAFEETFGQNALTEFFLYTGYLIITDAALEKMYDFHQQARQITIRMRHADYKNCHAAVDSASQTQTPFFAVHRRTIPSLSRESIALIAEFWSSRKLFESKNAATLYLEGLQKKLKYRRFRSLPKNLLKKGIGWIFSLAGEENEKIAEMVKRGRNNASLPHPPIAQ